MLSCRTTNSSIYIVCLACLFFIIHAITDDAQATIPQPQGEVVLEVFGDFTNKNTESSAAFDMPMLMELPVAELTTSTVVTDGIHYFRGFLMRDLLSFIDANGTIITATALNDYVIEFPANEFDKFDIIVAYAMNNQPLSPRDKGPLWIIYPRDQHPELQDIRYDYRWVWQLKRLDIR